MNTMQKEFDIVVAHLYKQGRPAKNIDGKCLYRHKTHEHGTLSCAVGCRIPDSRYSPKMEQNNVSSVLRMFGNRLSGALSTYDSMFTDLQFAHDRCNCRSDGTFNMKDLGRSLTSVSTKYSLKFNKPVEA
jgi:hypothetical protein